MANGGCARAGGSAGPKQAGYHSPLRARQAAETRRTIVDAAITLFKERGWAATTLPMVAAEAGTAVDTIYSVFGSKSGLLMEAIDLAIAGDDDPTAMVDRPELAEFGSGRQDRALAHRSRTSRSGCISDRCRSFEPCRRRRPATKRPGPD